MTFWKLYRVPLALTIVSSILYWYFAYNLVRTDYTTLVFLYTSLWLVFILLLKYAKNNIPFLTVTAFVFRAIFILAIPNLSQDFYRFIWDGQMLSMGFNPYLTTPEYQMSLGNLTGFPNQEELFLGMGSLNASHFTNYPPINQLCFYIANLFPGNSILSSVIGLKLLIIAADFGTFFFGKRLLQQLNIPVKHIFWYVLNPFIIIELTGNLHFEGVMIFFLVWSLYLLHSGRWKWSAVVFAFSISVKLIPLLFLPLLFRFFKKNEDSSKSIDIKKLISFYLIIGITTALLFIPFFSSEFINNYTETVALWFNNFEFNASVYYIMREIGFAITGFNEIAVIGKILPIIIFLVVMGLSIFKKHVTTKTLISNMLLAFTCYLFLSTTVHPWYLATLLLLSVFTNYKFPMVWSFVIILSYLAYININTADKSENLWIIAIEYIIVYSAFIWEVFVKKKINSKELS